MAETCTQHLKISRIHTFYAEKIFQLIGVNMIDVIKISLIYAYV
jgi:hypothetical protein